MTGPTIAACATALGGAAALIRLSGPEAFAIAVRAGLSPPTPWSVAACGWPLAGGTCPARVLAAAGPRSFTGCDLVEIVVPGARDLVELALEALVAAGAEPAPPGGFARQALANGRLGLDQAEAILALTSASDGAAAARALARLRGALSTELRPAREALLRLRALVEAGLDFLDEDDVRAWDPAVLRAELGRLRASVARWLTAADSLGLEPVVALVGPANAGKSALFARLTGAPALVSAVPGTTRDWLEAPWPAAGRTARLVDTAGWLRGASGLDAAAVERGRRMVEHAALVVACSAPDARLADADLELLPCERTVVVATKSDLGGSDARAELALSAVSGEGLVAIAALAGKRLAAIADADPRQQRLLREAEAIAAKLEERLPPDALLAEDLRRLAEVLGELIGAMAPDEVLEAIFSRFCIGK